MFEIGWPELMLIGLVALLVIGPKDLPKAIYGIGKWVRKARLVAREFQTHVDDMMREAELDELRQQALKARDFNMSQVMENALDPKGELKGALDLPPAPKLDETSDAVANGAVANGLEPNIAAPPTPPEGASPPEVAPAADLTPPQPLSTPEKSV